jgi:hypothetical protein
MRNCPSTQRPGLSDETDAQDRRDGRCRRVVTFPFPPPVTSANKPRGWNRWSAAEKVEHLLSMSLDRMHDYLAWPADGLDPYRLAAQAQVLRVVVTVAAKAGIEAHRERDRQRVLKELARRFGEIRAVAEPGACQENH